MNNDSQKQQPRLRYHYLVNQKASSQHVSPKRYGGKRRQPRSGMSSITYNPLRQEKEKTQPHYKLPSLSQFIKHSILPKKSHIINDIYYQKLKQYEHAKEAFGDSQQLIKQSEEHQIHNSMQCTINEIKQALRKKQQTMGQKNDNIQQNSINIDKNKLFGLVIVNNKYWAAHNSNINQQIKVKDAIQGNSHTKVSYQRDHIRRKISAGCQPIVFDNSSSAFGTNLANAEMTDKSSGSVMPWHKLNQSGSYFDKFDDSFKTQKMDITPKYGKKQLNIDNFESKTQINIKRDQEKKQQSSKDNGDKSLNYNQPDSAIGTPSKRSLIMIRKNGEIQAASQFMQMHEDFGSARFDTNLSTTREVGINANELEVVQDATPGLSGDNPNYLEHSFRQAPLTEYTMPKSVDHYQDLGGSMGRLNFHSSHQSKRLIKTNYNNKLQDIKKDKNSGSNKNLMSNSMLAEQHLQISKIGSFNLKDSYLSKTQRVGSIKDGEGVETKRDQGTSSYDQGQDTQRLSLRSILANINASQILQKDIIKQNHLDQVKSNAHILTVDYEEQHHLKISEAKNEKAPPEKLAQNMLWNQIQTFGQLDEEMLSNLVSFNNSQTNSLDNKNELTFEQIDTTMLRNSAIYLTNKNQVENKIKGSSTTLANMSKEQKRQLQLLKPVNILKRGKQQQQLAISNQLPEYKERSISVPIPAKLTQDVIPDSQPEAKFKKFQKPYLKAKKRLYPESKMISVDSYQLRKIQHVAKASNQLDPKLQSTYSRFTLNQPLSDFNISPLKSKNLDQYNSPQGNLVDLCFQENEANHQVQQVNGQSQMKVKSKKKLDLKLDMEHLKQQSPIHSEQPTDLINRNEAFSVLLGSKDIQEFSPASPSYYQQSNDPTPYNQVLFKRIYNQTNEQSSLLVEQISDDENGRSTAFGFPSSNKQETRTVDPRFLLQDVHITSGSNAYRDQTQLLQQQESSSARYSNMSSQLRNYQSVMESQGSALMPSRLINVKPQVKLHHRNQQRKIQKQLKEEIAVERDQRNKNKIRDNVQIFGLDKQQMDVTQSIPQFKAMAQTKLITFDGQFGDLNMPNQQLNANQNGLTLDKYNQHKHDRSHRYDHLQKDRDPSSHHNKRSLCHTPSSIITNQVAVSRETSHYRQKAKPRLLSVDETVQQLLDLHRKQSKKQEEKAQRLKTATTCVHTSINSSLSKVDKDIEGFKSTAVSSLQRAMRHINYANNTYDKPLGEKSQHRQGYPLNTKNDNLTYINQFGNLKVTQKNIAILDRIQIYKPSQEALDSFLGSPNLARDPLIIVSKVDPKAATTKLTEGLVFNTKPIGNNYLNNSLQQLNYLKEQTTMLQSQLVSKLEPAPVDNIQSPLNNTTHISSQENKAMFGVNQVIQRLELKSELTNRKKHQMMSKLLNSHHQAIVIPYSKNSYSPSSPYKTQTPILASKFQIESFSLPPHE